MINWPKEKATLESEIRSEADQNWLQFIAPLLTPSVRRVRDLLPLPQVGEPKLYFSTWEGGKRFIKTYNPETKKSTILRNLDYLDTWLQDDLVPSEDFRYVAYINNKDREIHVANSDGEGDIRVSFEHLEPSWEMDGSDLEIISWSPSGTKLLYKAEIHLMCVAGCPAGRGVPKDPSTELGYYLADFSSRETFYLGEDLRLFSWGPEDKLVLYLESKTEESRGSEAVTALFSYDLESRKSEVINIQGLPLGPYDLGPYHSDIDFENRKFVSAAAYLGGDHWGVIVGALDGKEMQTVVSGEWADYQWAGFSPDGQYFVFEKDEVSLESIRVYRTSSLEEITAFSGELVFREGWWDSETLFVSSYKREERLREFFLMDVEKGAVEKIGETRNPQ